MSSKPEEFEIPEGISWTPASDAAEEDAVVAGVDEEGREVRVARVAEGQEAGVASLISGSGEAHLGFFGETIVSAEFDLLIASTPVRWVFAQDGEIPDGAIPAGNDETGDVIFVARVVIKGCAFPAKLLARFHGAFAAFNLLEWFRRHYEVLCICEDDDAVDTAAPPDLGDLTDTHDEQDLGDDRRDDVPVPDGLAWSYAEDGDTFDNAVDSGEDAQGRAQHVVRGSEEWELASGVLTVGRCTVSIPYYGIGSKHDRYEVLVNEGEVPLKWIRAAFGRLPRNPVACGVNRKGELMYVARIDIEGDVIPGKLNVTKKRAYAARDGREYVRAKYQVLCIDDGEGAWEDGEEEEEDDGGDPNDVDGCGEDERKSEVPDLDGLSWVGAIDGAIPQGAVIVDGKGSCRIYVARASEERELVTGGVRKGAPAEMPYFEETIDCPAYEVLTVAEGEEEVPLFWVPAAGGEVPEGAVQGGLSESGEPIFVARALLQDEDRYVAGKVRPDFEHGFFAHEDDEMNREEYEVLTYGQDAECLDGATPARYRR